VVAADQHEPEAGVFPSPPFKRLHSLVVSAFGGMEQVAEHDQRLRACPFNGTRQAGEVVGCVALRQRSAERVVRGRFAEMDVGDEQRGGSFPEDGALRQQSQRFAVSLDPGVHHHS
jgi:hypothetical protein